MIERARIVPVFAAQIAPTWASGTIQYDSQYPGPSQSYIRGKKVEGFRVTHTKAITAMTLTDENTNSASP